MIMFSSKFDQKKKKKIELHENQLFKKVLLFNFIKLKPCSKVKTQPKNPNYIWKFKSKTQGSCDLPLQRLTE
jgi:hypothetical protein